MAFGCKSLSTQACSLPSCSHTVHLQWEDVVFTDLDPEWLQGSSLGVMVEALGAQVRLEHCMAVESQEKISVENFLCETYYIPGHAALSEAKEADLLW